MNAAARIKLIATISWRNIWKNKRRTALTLITVMVGTSMIILMRAIQDGGYEKMIEDVISANSGHIQIHNKGFWENTGIEYAFTPDESLESFVSKHPGIKTHTYRIHAAGLLSLGEATSGVIIQGIDPFREKKITSFHRAILQGGRYLSENDTDSVVLGHVLAKNLNAKVGDTVALISQGYDGSIAAENLVVRGLMKTGNQEYDRAMVLMPISQADSTFSMMGNINSLVIRVKDTHAAEGIRKELSDRFGKKGGTDDTGLEFMGYEELNPEVIQHIVMDKATAYIFYLILFLIVAFGILNTIQMSVFERTREFGVMLAVGTRPDQILGMVLFESVLITLLGILCGILAGSALSYYYTVYPMDYSKYAKEFETFNITTYVFPARLTLSNLATTSFVTMLLGVLFSIAPARRAAHLRPLEAIRQL